MATPGLKSSIGAIASASVIALLTTTTAQAAVFNFAFQVKIDQGPYQGTHSGTFRFDNAKMVPCLFNPNLTCATPGDSGLSVLFNFMGTTYTHASDVHAQTAKFPAVYYFPQLETVPPEFRSLNSPYLLSLIVSPPNGSTRFAILGRDFFTGFSDLSDPALRDSTKAVGRVTYVQLPTNNPAPPAPCVTNPAACDGGATAVPEPSEIAGSAVALGVFGLFWRSRRRQRVAFQLESQDRAYPKSNSL